MIIGGGGIWGLDFNKNIFVLSALLFLFSKLSRKNVYLLGIGYYTSTSFLGRISAYLAAKSAKLILARDPETFENFSKFNKANTLLDRDISFSLDEVSTDAYEKEAEEISKNLGFHEPITLVGFRRFTNKKFWTYTNTLFNFVRKNTSKKFSLVVFESKTIAPKLYSKMKALEQEHGNITASDFEYNPIAFILALKKHASNLYVIAPQYHVQISAHFAGIPFLPISYDNKVSEFHRNISKQSIAIHEMSETKILENL
ncbi:MAG: polysaccharide pyruvyl transferase family protein [Candidatus Moraniibacteriota bacterium]|nr:MAG: polysaccharide pyruvyl transferase family protein [Candidatus Moranbacteria bacterium]